MPLRRLLSFIAIFLAASAAYVGPAAAAGPYGPHAGSARVNKTIVEQGGSVTVSGDGFCRNARVKVTVSVDGHRYITKRVRADGDGDVSATLTLTTLGSNTIRLSGCRRAGGTQSLFAYVRVIPHQGIATVSDAKVDKGDRVTVSGTKFCPNTDVVLRVYDDGARYKTLTIESTGSGKASTSVRLARAGFTRLSLVGCRKAGGTQALSAPVKVRSSTSFHASPTAVVDSLQPGRAGAQYVWLAGIIVALGLGQLTLARLKRSRSH